MSIDQGFQFFVVGIAMWSKEEEKEEGQEAGKAKEEAEQVCLGFGG